MKLLKGTLYSRFFIQTVLKLISDLFALAAAVQACSSSPCSCPSGWTKEASPDGFICYQKQKDKATYQIAKETCKAIDTTFPLVDSDQDLEFYVGLKEK